MPGEPPLFLRLHPGLYTPEVNSVSTVPHPRPTVLFENKALHGAKDEAQIVNRPPYSYAGIYGLAEWRPSPLLHLT